jgi:hypothetical protein
MKKLGISGTRTFPTYRDGPKISDFSCVSWLRVPHSAPLSFRRSDSPFAVFHLGHLVVVRALPLSTPWSEFARS